jgi:hypothetical protein
MAEQLFWRVLEHLKTQSPGFAAGKSRGPAFRFKVTVIRFREVSFVERA